MCATVRVTMVCTARVHRTVRAIMVCTAHVHRTVRAIIVCTAHVHSTVRVTIVRTVYSDNQCTHHTVTATTNCPGKPNVLIFGRSRPQTRIVPK